MKNEMVHIMEIWKNEPIGLNDTLDLEAKGTKDLRGFKLCGFSAVMEGGGVGCEGCV